MRGPLSEAQLTALRGIADGTSCPKRQRIPLARIGYARFYNACVETDWTKRVYTEEITPLGKEILADYEGSENALISPTLEDALADQDRGYRSNSFSILTLSLWIGCHSGKYPNIDGLSVGQRNAKWGRMVALVRKTVNLWAKEGKIEIEKPSYFEPGHGRMHTTYRVVNSFPVTDDLDDAPDGATVDGFTRHGRERE